MPGGDTFVDPSPSSNVGVALAERARQRERERPPRAPPERDGATVGHFGAPLPARAGATPQRPVRARRPPIKTWRRRRSTPFGLARKTIVEKGVQRYAAPVGWFSRFRRAQVSNELARVPNVLERFEALERTVSKLELDRPAFVTSLEELAERCHDILDSAESKRGRVAAMESRRRKREEETEPEVDPNDRSAVLAGVRARLRAQGKLH